MVFSATRMFCFEGNSTAGQRGLTKRICRKAAWYGRRKASKLRYPESIMNRHYEDPNYTFRVAGTEAMGTCRHCKLEMKTGELDKHPKNCPKWPKK
jgi:hypothetical protein